MDHKIGIGHECGVPAVSLMQDRFDAARFGAGAPQLSENGSW
jgi:hypothetical protein